MKTEQLKADEAGVRRAAELLRCGEIVAIPTETVYGLAADVSNGGAEKLNELKGSPKDKPITWLTSEVKGLNGLAAELFENHATVIVDYNGRAQGFRKPGNEFALKLLEELDCAFACTSANLSGGKAAGNADEVMEVFEGRIAAVVDGGECEVGIASAVVDFTKEVPEVLRNGSGLKSS